MLKRNDIDFSNTDSFHKPLKYAVENNQLFLVKVLLDTYSVNYSLSYSSKDSAFFCAVKNGNKELIKLFLLHALVLKNNNHFDLIYYNGNLKLYKQFVQGIQSNEIQPFIDYINKDKYMFVNYMIKLDLFYKEEQKINEDLKNFVIFLSFKKFFNFIVDNSNFYQIKEFVYNKLKEVSSLVKAYKKT